MDPPRLLCLGRLVPEKGVDLAVAALGRLVKRFPRLELVVAGDGPERAKLERQASDLGLRHLVSFRGWIAPDQVPHLINTATLVLVPSRWEGLPGVAIQAGQMARPVVGARIWGLPEIVEHGKTGLLIEPEDCAGLADAIATLLDHPEQATRMGRGGRRRVEQLFGWDRYVDAYDVLYRSLGQGVGAC
jgi:glycogen(starch) synthase